MDWFGASPGGSRNGKPCFGVAWLRKNGSFETSSTDCAHSALRWIQKRSVGPSAMGIDCPLWWSSSKSGERQVDLLLRRKYRDHNIGQSVRTSNSLPGSVLVQGMMLASEARKQWKEIKITETHPRARSGPLSKRVCAHSSQLRPTTAHQTVQLFQAQGHLNQIFQRLPTKAPYSGPMP